MLLTPPFRFRFTHATAQVNIGNGLFPDDGLVEGCELYNTIGRETGAPVTVRLVMLLVYETMLAYLQSSPTLLPPSFCLQPLNIDGGKELPC